MAGDAGLVNLVFLLFIGLPFFIVLPAWCYVRILRRAGYSGWWTIVMWIPLANAIAIWVFAFIEWPRHTRPVESVGGSS